MNTPDRRQFLGALAAAGLGARLQAEEKRRPPLGFSLYGMKTLAPAEALRQCAAIGYDGVELALMPGWPTEPARLSAAARRQLAGQLTGHGLALLGLMENLVLLAEGPAHGKNLERIRAAADLGRALGGGKAPVMETILGGKPEQWEKVKRQMADRLGTWARVAEECRMVLAVKAHVGGALHRPEDARWLVEQVKSPWVKLAYDYSHFQLRGLSLKESLETMLPHTAFIHVKDARGTASKFQFLLPGQGTIDYGAYARLLAKADWTGPVVVEVSGQVFGKPGYDPVAAAKKSYAPLARAFRGNDER